MQPTISEPMQQQDNRMLQEFIDNFKRKKDAFASSELCDCLISLGALREDFKMETKMSYKEDNLEMTKLTIPYHKLIMFFNKEGKFLKHKEL